MSVLGNIIWLGFGGFFMALEYLVSGFYYAVPSSVYLSGYRFSR